MQKHKVIFGFNLSIVLAMLLIYLFNNNIPDTVPTHYNLFGGADDYGAKWQLLLLVGINLLIIVGMFYVILNPEKANYPYQITEQNREKSYNKMQNLFSFLSLACTLLFFFLFVDSAGIFEKNNAVFYGLLLVIFFAPMFLLFSGKAKK